MQSLIKVLMRIIWERKMCEISTRINRSVNRIEITVLINNSSLQYWQSLIHYSNRIITRQEALIKLQRIQNFQKQANSNNNNNNHSNIISSSRTISLSDEFQPHYGLPFISGENHGTRIIETFPPTNNNHPNNSISLVANPATINLRNTNP